MNPQENASSPQGGLSLPPVEPQTPNPVAPVAPDQSDAAQPATAANAPAPIPSPAPAIPTSAGQSTAATAPDDSPMIADDTDLIEKEWVEKAKQLVEQTKNDPYKQNQEINKIKATYIKKRYNKDIQISSD